VTTQERTPEGMVERVQELSDRLEALPDPVARESAQEMVAAVMDLYDEGLRRILEAVEAAGDAAAALRQELLSDGVVASLLLIHGLYPVDLETRVTEALDGVRPYMHSHGGDVELIALEDGVARLRLEGSCRGCPASSATLEQAIRTALEEAAPDLSGMVVEGAEAPVRAPGPS